MPDDARSHHRGGTTGPRLVSAHGARTPHQSLGRRLKIDLETMRETLAYMHDDTRRCPELAALSHALARTLDEIDAVEGPCQKRIPPSETLHPLAVMRFERWKPGT